MNTTTLGIDLAKNIFQLHGVDKNGRVTFRKALSRSKFPVFIAQLPPLFEMKYLSGFLQGFCLFVLGFFKGSVTIDVQAQSFHFPVKGGSPHFKDPGRF